MSKDQNAENRLIILYLLNKIDIEITDLHLTEIFRSNNLMNYFTMQDQLSQLVESNFIKCELSDNDRLVYTITDEGREILSTLTSLIPIGIRLTIDDIVLAKRTTILNEYQIDADFTAIDENNFIVTCYSMEGNNEIIKFDVNVPTREDAFRIKDNWKAHASEIYADILKVLYQDRDKK